MPPERSHGGYLACPMCDAEVPITGDEKIGEEIFCLFCTTPLKLKKTKTDELFLEENF